MLIKRVSGTIDPSFALLQSFLVYALLTCNCALLYAWAHARLIFSGKQMNDDKMAKEYNIEGGSVLHLVGGAHSVGLGHGQVTPAGAACMQT